MAYYDEVSRTRKSMEYGERRGANMVRSAVATYIIEEKHSVKANNVEPVRHVNRVHTLDQ